MLLVFEKMIKYEMQHAYLACDARGDSTASSTENSKALNLYAVFRFKMAADTTGMPQGLQMSAVEIQQEFYEAIGDADWEL